MKTTHTQGEWRVLQSCKTIVDTPKSTIIQKSLQLTDEERQANAKLIAAAPELLLRARQILSAIDYGILTKYQLDVVEGLERAIKQATE